MSAAPGLAGLLAAVLLISCCAAVVVGAGGIAAVNALEDRRTAGSQLEDESNELRAASRISERFQGVHVNITSFNRAVLLTGEVRDAATRDAIEKIAAGLPNVRSVANELEVAGASSLTSRSNDSIITSKVKLRLLDARRVNPMHVKVVTEASVVYLMGILTQQEGNDATEVARTTGGVRKVVKIFEYCEPTDDLCRPSGPPSASAQKARPGG